MTRPCETPGCPHRARPRRGNAGRHPRWCADCTRARRATSNATYYASHRAACLARHASHYALHAERKKAARRQRYLESKRAALRAILTPHMEHDDAVA